MLSVRVWLRLPQTRLWVQGQRRGAFGSSRERILNSESTSTRVQSCGRSHQESLPGAAIAGYDECMGVRVGHFGIVRKQCRNLQDAC